MTFHSIAAAVWLVFAVCGFLGKNQTAGYAGLVLAGVWMATV